MFPSVSSNFLNGSFVAVAVGDRLGFLLKGDRIMSFFGDPILKAKLLKDIQDLYRKRTELEADLRNLEALVLHRLNKGALLDIAAYKASLSRPQMNLF